MPLLRRRAVFAAKTETTVGTAETITASEGAYNARDFSIQPTVAVTRREGQGGEDRHREDVPVLEDDQGGGRHEAGEAAVTGLDHVVVNTPDPERAAALYGARLGLDMKLDRSNPDWGTRLMFFRLGDLVVEVAHSLKAGVSDGPDAPWGLSWRVADVAAAQARLKAAGADVSEVRTGRKPGTAVFTVKDAPGGVPTLVIGPAA